LAEGNGHNTEPGTAPEREIEEEERQKEESERWRGSERGIAFPARRRVQRSVKRKTVKMWQRRFYRASFSLPLD